MNLKSITNICLFKIRNHYDIKKITENFKGKRILEIGGPSSIFGNKLNGIFSIYNSVKTLDNINFSHNTIWENQITEGHTFKYGNRTGKQFVLEASDLRQINDLEYDGLISSHCLEHTANPIKVLFEWKRVIKKEGFILLILPNKEYTFDHKRPYSTFEHLLSDYKNEVKEDDLTHLDEILELHDISMDKGLTSSSFKERSLQNFKNRCLHHHVFNDELVYKIAEYTGLELLNKNKFQIHLVYLLKKK